MVEGGNSETDCLSPLPSSREALGTLLHEVGKIIEQLNVVLQHQRFRVDTIRKSTSKSWTKALGRRELLRAMHATSTELWAKGIPSLRLVDSYLSQERLHYLADEYHRLTNRLHQSIDKRPQNLAECASSLEEVANVQEDFLTMMLELRSRIMVALDRLTDTDADTRKKSLVNPPRNPKTLELYLRLEGRDPKETSERAFATDFCDGDAKEAETLLKGVRRFRNRLKEAGF